MRALLTDGRVVTIRELAATDAEAVRLLHEQLPETDRYLRFFTLGGPDLAGLAQRMTDGDAQRAALGAFDGDLLVGVANYEVLADPAVAEVALAVRHAVQAQGVGTLLLEHLVSVARRRGVRLFTADVLAENSRMLRVFTDLGLPCRLDRDGGDVRVRLSLDADERYLDAVAERERRADRASLRAVLRPESVAVVGASRRERSVGGAVLRRIAAGGFRGRLYAVNPHADEVAGVAAHPDVAHLPEAPDLAVLCVPAEQVPAVARACGQRGVRALLVITAGVTGSAELRDGLLAAVREHGMRLVGPNCLGLVNTDPLVRLDATFSDLPATAGPVGVVTQSGGAGIAVLDQLAPLGLGVSTMVSTGDKYDVSGNDLMRWWLTDDRTRVAVLYLESFGNPRAFSRVARRLAAGIPVLAVRTGSSEVARRAAASHTAAAATPAVTRDALYQQAGVQAVDTLTDLVAATATLCWQPVPATSTAVVLSNAGGAGVLAADACTALGLGLPPLSPDTRDLLRAALPGHGTVGNPVDTTAGVDAETFGACLDVLLADPAVPAVIAIAAPTALGDPATAIAEAVARARSRGVLTPVVAVRLGQTATVRPLRYGAECVPSFADPAVAAGALAVAARRGRWLARPAGLVPDLPGLCPDDARAVAREFLAEQPDGGWLDPDRVTALLRAAGLPVLAGRTATDEEAAVAAFRELGGPVAVKAVARGLLHKSRGGGVVLGVTDENRVRTQWRLLRERFGADLVGVHLQPMAEPGRELLVGVTGDPTFGPLVVFGLGGVDTDLVADRASRLVPLTDTDATDLLHGLRAAPALFGPEPEVDVDAVRDVLLRVGRLAELVPEIAELDLNPVIATRTGCVAVDSRVLLRPVTPTDPLLPALRV